MWSSSRRSIAGRFRALRLPRFRRFVVSDESMVPTLQPGQGLIGLASSRARPGQIRVVEHPHRPDFWLVKRVVSTDGGSMHLRSDNQDRPTVDSRQLGDLPIEGSYRVVVRVPVALM
ncbi:MAG: S24 family peptidase [Ilumatobacter sp.]